MKYQKEILESFLHRVGTISLDADQQSFAGRVASWAGDRNLLRGSCPLFQMEKLSEEVDELGEAVLTFHGPLHESPDVDAFKDAVGDIQVVLAVMCAQAGIDIDECREVAWSEIKDRKGEMRDGIFVKEAGN